MRCIFLVLNPLAATKVSDQGLDAEGVLNFWSTLESGPVWKAALEAATNVDYIALKAAFKTIEDVIQVVGR